MATDSVSMGDIYRDALRAAWLGLAVNMALGGAKLFAGLLGNSFALLADALNSLGDSLTSVLTLVGLWYAQRPADAEHPYGHTRAEPLAGAYVSLGLVASGAYIGWEAISRMTDQHENPALWTLWIAGGSAAIKEMLYRYKRDVGERTGSTAVIANAWDHRSDALCSLAVFIGLLIVQIAGPEYFWIDEGAALVVAVVVLWTGVRLLRRCSSDLLDPQADEDVVANIRQSAMKVPGVRAVEKLWVRKTGLEYFVDIHIQVDAKLTVAAGHEIGHGVKDHLIAQYATIRDVLVHLEPFPE